MTASLTYVYAVCRDVPAAVTAELTGVAGAPVRAVPCADLQAVVSDVSAEEFSAERLESSLQDLEWLADTARAHHRVVDTVGRHTAVAPLSLATVFHDPDRVRESLAGRREALLAVLDRLRDRAEWGVKAYLPAEPRQAETAAADRPASGREYLARRRAAVHAAQDRTTSAERDAEDLHDAAAAVSVDARRHRVHDSSLTGRSEPMVLNAAYLVEDTDVERWRDAVEQASPTGLLVQVTGPWVPYSFAEVPDDGAAR